MTAITHNWSAITHDLLFKIVTILKSDTRTIQAVLCVCKDWLKLQEKQEFKKSAKLADLKLNYRIHRVFFDKSNEFYINSNFLWDISPTHCFGQVLFTPEQSATDPDVKFTNFRVDPTDGLTLCRLLFMRDNIAFFAMEGLARSAVVKIFNFSNGYLISTIDFTKFLPNRHLYNDNNIAIIPLENNEILTIISQIILKWNVKDLFHPEFISQIHLPKTESLRSIERVFKINSCLIIHERAGELRNPSSWIRVFNLNTNVVVCEKAFTMIAQMKIVYDKFIIMHLNIESTIFFDPLQNQKLQGYSYEDNTFSLVWEKEIEKTIKVRNNLSSAHPYFLLVNGEFSEKINFVILDIRTGCEVLSVDLPPAPCIPGAKCNLAILREPGICGQRYYAYVKLMEDIVVLVSRHQIDFWSLPSGMHRMIKLPLVHRMLSEDKLNDLNVFFNQDNLCIQYPKEVRPGLNEVVVDIYRPRNKPLEKSSNNLVRPRKEFAKVAISTPSFLLVIINHVIDFITFFHFWGPRSRHLSFKAKLTNSARCLKQIIVIPFLLIGIQFAALYGIINPSQGEKLLLFFQRRYWSSESDFRSKMYS